MLFSIKNPARFFIDIGKIIVKFIWKDKGSRIAKTTFKKNNKVEKSTPDFNVLHLYNFVISRLLLPGVKFHWGKVGRKMGVVIKVQ